MSSLFAANVGVLLTLTFVAHQMLLSLDAVVRTLIRRLVTGRRLLEWETAAEAELGRRSGRRSMCTWTGFLCWLSRLRCSSVVQPQGAFYAALPVLVLWAGSKFISMWLNRPHTRAQAAFAKRRFILASSRATHLALFCRVQHRKSTTG